MNDSSARIQDVNLQFKLKDLFLDFLACLVPGIVFVISITLLIGGLFYIGTNSIALISSDVLNSLAIFSNEFFRSYTFHFWVTLAIIFISFIVGHLLYRLNPKTPDYASFIRVREKVMSKKNDWVVPLGHGIVSQEVQFPYQNLKKYLEIRGFDYLAKNIFWDADYKDTSNESANDKTKTVQRSKSFINKLKIRISYYFPNKTMNIIRNEAHIRLASSVWYATKYIIKTSYFCLFIIFVLTLVYYFAFISNTAPQASSMLFKKTIIPLLERSREFIFYLLLFSILLPYITGLIAKFLGDNIMASWRAMYYPKDGLLPKNDSSGSREFTAKNVSSNILLLYNFYDLAPLCTFIQLLITSLLMYFCYSNVNSTFLLRQLILYNVLASFILIGAIFVKRRIEETIHYQRVREIIYVLETAFLGNLFKDEIKSQKKLILT